MLHVTPEETEAYQGEVLDQVYTAGAGPVSQGSL